MEATRSKQFPPYDKKKLDEFKTVYQERGSYDFISQVPYLYSLAEYYDERFKTTNHWADAVKAHGLYNSCASRDGKALWIERAFAIQTLYWNGSINLSYQEQLSITASLKRKLQRVRQTVKSDLLDVKQTLEEAAIINHISEIADLSNIMQKKMPEVMKRSNNMVLEVARSVMENAAELVADSTNFVLQFCVVGLGSISREEATPYSDIEFMFLIPDTKMLDKWVYEKLAVTCYFLMINIGETPLTCLEIAELGHGSKRWFIDKARSGFRFDVLQEQGGHNATGNRNILDEKLNPYIGSVSEMVARYTTVYDNPDFNKCFEGDFSTMLSGLVYIYGDESLLIRLRQQIYSRKCSEMRQVATKHMLQSDIKRYNFGPDEGLREWKSAKRDFFRYASVICFDFKLYFDIDYTRVLDVIRELHKKTKISKGLENNLKTLYCTAQFMRQASYAYYDSQHKGITVGLTHINSVNERTLWNIPQYILSLCLAQLIPVKRQINDSMSEISILLEDRKESQTMALAITKYYCGDYRGFLREMKTTESNSSLESDYAVDEMRIISLIHCNQFDKVEQILEESIKCESNRTSENKLARLHTIMSELYVKTGHYNKASEICEKALSIRLKIYSGVDHRDIASSYNNIARVCENQGDYNKALHNYEKALSIHLKVHGNIDHPDIASSYNNIASVYQNQGDYKTALHNYEKALSICLKVNGNVDHPDMALSYNNIASVYQNQDDYKKALDNYNKALYIHSKVYGDIDHPHMASSYNNIASVCQNQGDYNKALDTYKKALSIQSKVYGDIDHPHIASSYNNIASVCQNQGDYKKALHNYDKALSIHNKVYGTVAHPDIASSYDSIASVFQNQGNYRKAVNNYRKALSIRLKVYGNVDHRNIALSYNNIASVCENQCDYKTALDNYNKALSIHSKVYGTVAHPDIASSYNSIASVYQNQGNYKNALDNYKKALYIQIKVYGDIDHPHVASSFNNIASVCQNQGDYKKALHNYDKALSIHNKVYGDINHPHIASSYNNIASVCQNQGDYKKALHNYDKALSIHNKVYGDINHPHIASSYNNIASVCQNQCDYKKALDNYKKALSIQNKVYGTVVHPDMASSYNNIASVYQNQGNYRKALDKYKKALSILVKVYANVDHRDVASSYNKIASVYQNQGNYRKALDKYKNALSILLKVYANVDHPHIASSYTNIASVYQNQGDYKTSLDNYEKALSIRLKVHGNVDHPDIASSYNNIASVYQNQGNYRKALDNYEKALSISLKVYSDLDHPDIASSCINIASAYQNQGNYRKALDNYEKALSIRLKVYGDIDHPDIASSYINIASAYQNQGDYETALDNYEKALSIESKVYGDADHPDIASSYDNIASVNHNQGNCKKALKNFKKAQSIRLKVYGDVDHPDIASSYTNIASVYQIQGNYRNALKSFKKALSIRLKVYGDVDHPDIASSYNNIASVYQNQGNYRNALKNFKKALSIRLKVYGDIDHPDIASSYTNIASVYENQGDYKTSLDNYEKALSIRLKVHGNVDHPDIASSYINIASAYQNQGDYNTALDNYEKALSIHIKIHGSADHPDIASAYINIAAAYKNQGNFKALKRYKEFPLISPRGAVHDASSHIPTSYCSLDSLYRNQADCKNKFYDYVERESFWLPETGSCCEESSLCYEFSSLSDLSDCKESISVSVSTFGPELMQNYEEQIAGNETRPAEVQPLSNPTKMEISGSSNGFVSTNHGANIDSTDSSLAELEREVDRFSKADDFSATSVTASIFSQMKAEFQREILDEFENIPSLCATFGPFDLTTVNILGKEVESNKSLIKKLNKFQGKFEQDGFKYKLFDSDDDELVMNNYVFVSAVRNINVQSKGVIGSVCVGTGFNRGNRCVFGVTAAHVMMCEREGMQVLLSDGPTDDIKEIVQKITNEIRNGIWHVDYGNTDQIRTVPLSCNEDGPTCLLHYRELFQRDYAKSKSDGQVFSSDIALVHIENHNDIVISMSQQRLLCLDSVNHLELLVTRKIKVFFQDRFGDMREGVIVPTWMVPGKRLWGCYIAFIAKSNSLIRGDSGSAIKLYDKESDTYKVIGIFAGDYSPRKQKMLSRMCEEYVDLQNKTFYRATALSNGLKELIAEYAAEYEIDCLDLQDGSDSCTETCIKRLCTMELTQL